MSNKVLEVGDVVSLNSGGPKMTIDEKQARGIGSTPLRVKCKWFSEDGYDGSSITYEETFDIRTLKLAETES